MCVLFLTAKSKKIKNKKNTTSKKIKTAPSEDVDRYTMQREAAFSLNYLRSSSRPGVTTGGAAGIGTHHKGPMRRRASNAGAMMQRRVKDGAQQEHPAAKRGPCLPPPHTPFRSTRPFDRGGPTRLSSADAM